jgi:hypothetical protein
VRTSSSEGTQTTKQNTNLPDNYVAIDIDCLHGCHREKLGAQNETFLQQVFSLTFHQVGPMSLIVGPMSLILVCM